MHNGKKTWTIKDSLNNLQPVGDYDLRLDEISVLNTKSEEENTYPNLKFLWTIVSGQNVGETITQIFPMNPRYIGILGTCIAGCGEFTEDEELPANVEALARVLEARMAGKVYEVYHEHAKSKGRVFPKITIKGPSMANFK